MNELYEAIEKKIKDAGYPRNKMCIRDSSCTVLCRDRPFHCTAEYLAGDRWNRTWRSLDRNSSDWRENGTCTQDAGSSGKCKSIFLICDGISGRGKTTAGQIRSGENTFYGTGGIRWNMYNPQLETFLASLRKKGYTYIISIKEGCKEWDNF